MTPRIAEVARLYAARWPVADIASRMKISERSVRDYATRARKAGAVLPRAPMPGNGNGRVDALEAARLRREGLRLAEIAARYGVKVNAVSARTIALADLGVNIGKVRARPGTAAR